MEAYKIPENIDPETGEIIDPEKFVTGQMTVTQLAETVIHYASEIDEIAKYQREKIARVKGQCEARIAVLNRNRDFVAGLLTEHMKRLKKHKLELPDIGTVRHNSGRPSLITDKFDELSQEDKEQAWRAMPELIKSVVTFKPVANAIKELLADPNTQDSSLRFKLSQYFSLKPGTESITCTILGQPASEKGEGA